MSEKNPDRDRLDSWKEIAAFLEREVRTVQRWEKSEGLPVHRHQHEKLGSVYAFKSELLEWKESRRAPSPEPRAAETSKTGGEPRRRRSVRWFVAVAAALVGLITMWSLFRPTDPGREQIRLVVLPFENIGNDPDNEYLADGITEELGARLARLNSNRLGVIAATSASRYKGTSKSIAEVARELEVAYVVEGSLRREGDRARVTAQLIQAKDETRLWSETIDTNHAQAFSVWDEVAGRIGARLSVELLSESKDPSGRASLIAGSNDAYLRGRFFLNRRTVDDLETASSYFGQSIEADPRHARAHAGLATAHALLATAGYDARPPGSAMPRAKEHANAALSLDPDLSEAHATLAYATMLYDRDWSRAEQGFLRAIALDPRSAETRHWYAYFLTAMGRGDEALEQVRLALDLDPVSLPVNAGVGWHLYFAGRYEEAAAQLQRTLELDPDFPLARLELGMTYLQLGRVSAAIEELEVAARRSGGAPIHLAALGGVYAQAGRSDEAREILGRLERLAEERYVPSLYFSGMRLALGDKERALDGLEAAYDERSGYLLYLRRDPVFVSLHSEPRFQALLSRLGVP